MSSDTGDSVLDDTERRKLKRALDAARGKESDQQIIYIRQEGKKDDKFAQFKDYVFVAVVLAMGGFTWSNSISQAAINATLKTTVENLQSTVAELTKELKELKTRIKP
jgi:hypothetical protein